MSEKVSGQAASKLAGDYLNVTPEEVGKMALGDVADVIQTLAGSVLAQAPGGEKVEKRGESEQAEDQTQSE